MVLIEEQNIKCGKFNNVDLITVMGDMRITGYYFNKNNDLKGSIELLKYPVNKKLNVRVINKKGDHLAEFKNVQSHASFQKVKEITVMNFDNFILVKVMI